MVKLARSASPYMLEEAKSEGNGKYLCYIIHKNNFIVNGVECDPAYTGMWWYNGSNYIINGQLYRQNNPEPLFTDENEKWVWCSNEYGIRGGKFYKFETRSANGQHGYPYLDSLTLLNSEEGFTKGSDAGRDNYRDYITLLKGNDIYRIKTSNGSLTRITSTGTFVDIAGNTSSPGDSITQTGYAIDNTGTLYTVGTSSVSAVTMSVPIKHITTSRYYYESNSSPTSYDYRYPFYLTTDKRYGRVDSSPYSTLTNVKQVVGYFYYTRAISTEYYCYPLILCEDGTLYHGNENKQITTISDVQMISSTLDGTNNACTCIANQKVYTTDVSIGINNYSPKFIEVGEVIGEPVFMGGTTTSTSSNCTCMIITKVN